MAEYCDQYVITCVSCDQKSKTSAVQSPGEAWVFFHGTGWSKQQSKCFCYRCGEKEQR